MPGSAPIRGRKVQGVDPTVQGRNAMPPPLRCHEAPCALGALGRRKGNSFS